MTFEKVLYIQMIFTVAVLLIAVPLLINEDYMDYVMEKIIKVVKNCEYMKFLLYALLFIGACFSVYAIIKLP